MTKGRKYRDVANREVIHLLEDSLGRNYDTCIVWRGKCKFQVLVELHGNVHSGSERGDMGPVLTQFPTHVAIFFQI